LPDTGTFVKMNLLQKISVNFLFAIVVVTCTGLLVYEGGSLHSRCFALASATGHGGSHLSADLDLSDIDQVNPPAEKTSWPVPENTEITPRNSFVTGNCCLSIWLPPENA
jgi:hypothetical protein